MNVSNLKNPGSARVKICLNMIVRNEAAIIERSLASTIGHIDYYVIGDTGSSDNTMEIIKSFFDKHGVPGEIHQFPFIDFEQARNAALEHARASEGDFDYIFFNDADMELKPDPDWKKNIIYPVCSIRQKNNSISYYNARLLHRSLEGRYVGKTHEYLSTPIAAQPIEGVWLMDHANGSSRSEKTERDLRLLKQSLSENPNDQRSLFYIAQTLKDLGRWYDALGYYKRRIKAGGWAEEVWYSAYMVALCYKQLGNEAQFVAKSLEAFEMRPWRAEPLLPLATHYRELGKNELALMISERGACVEFPKKDNLFVENHVYQYAFDNEIAIAGFYTKDHNKRRQAYDICMALSVSKEADKGIQQLALSNSRFYAKKAIELFPSFVAQQMPSIAEMTTGYTAMNPSVGGISTDNKVHCVVRTVNYWMKGGHYLSPDNIIRTENYLCELSYPDFNLISSKKIEVQVNESQTDFPVKNHEDCRPFWWKGEWWGTATVRDRHPSGQCEVSMFTLKGDKEHVFRPGTESPIADRNQKNWMAIVLPPSSTGEAERLLFVYSCDPTVVLEVVEIEPDQYQLKNYRVDPSPIFALSELRGSSQCVLIHEEAEQVRYLLIGHEAFSNGGIRDYLHRFVELDAEFRITRVSDLFHFVQSGIEFCAGMTLLPQGQVKEPELLISFGVADKEAWISHVKLSDVEKQLKEPQPSRTAKMPITLKLEVGTDTPKAQ